MEDKIIHEYEDKYVTINYSFKTLAGEVLGSSEISGPFSFRIGSGDAIPGLEQHLLGAESGDRLAFTIPAKEAYGEYNPHLVTHLARSSFPESLALSLGLQLHLNNKKVVVTDIQDNTVTVDENHPLAGQDLAFEVEVLSISDSPTPHDSCGCNKGGCSCK